MALPATDNFNRSNGALGANWSGGPDNDLAISSNTVVGTTDLCDMYWSADTPDDAQYAQLKINTGEGYNGVCCRMNSTDFVFLASDAGPYKILWYNGGANTQIGSNYGTSAANDIIKITADGSTFKGYINGTERISGSNASAPASGGGGVWTYSASYPADDFEVGNLGAAAASLVPSMPLKYAVPSLVR